MGARPQTSNKTSSFTNEAVEAAIEVASENVTTQSFFTNFAVDGVSAESRDVITAKCSSWMAINISWNSGQQK